jgi:hypothetical protein
MASNKKIILRIDGSLNFVLASENQAPKPRYFVKRYLLPRGVAGIFLA